MQITSASEIIPLICAICVRKTVALATSDKSASFFSSNSRYLPFSDVGNSIVFCESLMSSEKTFLRKPYTPTSPPYVFFYTSITCSVFKYSPTLHKTYTNPTLIMPVKA